MTVEELRKSGWIIFEAISGSKAYGTSLSTSDTDIRGVFIQSKKSLLSDGFMEQVMDEKNDIVFYEIRKFLIMAAQNRPNMLEILFLPDDCIIYKDPIFDQVLERRKEFLSKICKASFGGFAESQIKKSRGLNKKINWEEAEMTRKTVLDFCYVLERESGKSVLFMETLPKTILSRAANGELLHENNKPSQEDYALAKVNHTKGVYAMYYLGDKGKFGIVSDSEKSNDVQVFSIPKGKRTWNYLFFNKDAYSIHCKRFAEYQQWLDNRNEDRFKMNKSHGKNYDSKNMMHLIRILLSGEELARTGNLRVRMSLNDIKLLMRIRRGEYEYDKIIEYSDELISKMDRYFAVSELPELPAKNLPRDIAYKVRTEYYKK